MTKLHSNPVVALTVMVTAVVSLAACRPDHSTSGTDEKLKILRRGLGGEPGTLDPAAAGDSFSTEVLGDLYEGLTSQSPDGTLQPGIAQSWSIDDAGLTYTFALRHDAKWSNGIPVKADDFVVAWRRVLDPKTGSPTADNLRPIAGAEDIITGRAAPTALGASAPREDELVVHLQKPTPYFLQVLTQWAAYPVYSEEAAKSHGGKSWVSNGAYVLDSWSPGDVLRLSKNRQYWDNRHVAISQVIYVPAPDENAQLRQYRAGQLDVTDTVPPGALPALLQERRSELHVTPYLATSYYAFNLHTAPFKDNRDLRQALTMAIDRKALLANILPFGQQAAFGFVPPGTGNYTPQRWDWQSLDDGARIAQARALFVKAGFSAKKPLRLKLLFNANSNIKQLAIGIAALWKDVLGIETELIEEEYRVFLQSRKDIARWDMVRLSWAGDYNDAANFLDTFRSNSPNDDSGYSNKEFDALLDQAAATGDEEQRRQLLERAEALMLSDYPVIPIYFVSSKRLFQPFVTGEAANPLNRLFSKHLDIAGH